MSRPYYLIEAMYSAEHYPALDHVLEKVAGGCCQSGIGFGERDIGWTSPQKRDATRTAQRLLRVRHVLAVFVTRYSRNEEDVEIIYRFIEDEGRGEEFL